MRVVHEKRRDFPCSLCESKFTQHSHLKAHIAAVHEREKRHQCQQCKSAFSPEWRSGGE